MGLIMPKALLVLLGLTAIGACVLQLRQESLDLRYRTAQLHREIQKAQSQLWRQQLEIAEYTSPQVMQAMTQSVQGVTATVEPLKDDSSARE